MSLRITRGGMLDTIQDLGRYGFQFQGINPGGAMDVVAAQLANIIAGNTLNEAVIEMHFPASTFLFEEDVLIALSGGDFGACINDQPVPVYAPIIIKKYSTLHFKKPMDGARCYLAVHGGFKIPVWLNSYSTHLKVVAGGMQGRCLRTNDQLVFQRKEDYSELLKNNDYRILPWKADHALFYSKKNCIRISEGTSYQQLAPSSKSLLVNHTFFITHQSDRMGYRMKGEPLELQHHEELISSVVVNGTIQLLPDGQLIILMADHQTTGGYPVLAHVISADLPILAQLNSNHQVQFQMIGHVVAEQLLLEQHHYLQRIQDACTLRWLAFFQELNPF
ncbi:MAG: biotin-dependent carboxyltransferase family protein [Chitinophagales bacterium]